MNLEPGKTDFYNWLIKLGAKEDEIYRRRNKRIISSKLDDMRKGTAHKYLNKGNNDHLSVIEEG